MRRSQHINSLSTGKGSSDWYSSQSIFQHYDLQDDQVISLDEAPPEIVGINYSRDCFDTIRRSINPITPFNDRYRELDVTTDQELIDIINQDYDCELFGLTKQ